MRFQSIIPLATLALTGCLSEAQFEDQFADSLCQKSNECLEAEGLSPIDCNQELEEETGSEVDCTYHGNYAKDCLDELETATCDGAILSVPSICGMVYTDCQ